tara:strand:+ start:241 stop:480 length:240 start_codon:yes stop_codon:yes gene_type:complete
VKFFWPNRSKAKGFLIENNACKYRENISSLSSKKISNQFSDNRNLKSIKEDSIYIDISHLSIKRGHWANRDFSEYREVA